MRMIILLVLLTGCSSSGYNRQYIVSDTLDETIAIYEISSED